MPVKPRRIGRYALYAELASGGMATVHFGRLLGPVGFAKSVAIKRLHPQFAKDRAFVEMFVEEARLAARVQHPNVVPTLDVVVDEGEVFLVMEYVHGASLSRLLEELEKNESKLPIEIAASIFAGSLHGLHAAHEATNEQGVALGIVHRDVSPQNILVGVDGVARVMDFGVAKAAGRLQTTREGQIKGKIAYLAPEQLDGAPLDRRADIYAAGVVLWEALAGTRLFTGDNEASVLVKVLSQEPGPPSRIRAEIPPELDRVTLKALSRNPEERYASAREMALAIEAAVTPAAPSRVGSFVQETLDTLLRVRRERLTEIERTEPETETESESTVVAPTKKNRVLSLAIAVVVLILGFVLLRERFLSANAPTPPPAAGNGEALAAFHDGMQALHDGAVSVAVLDFEKAVEKDPELSAAHLRLAYFSFYAGPDRAREHLLHAVKARESLSPHDAALLDAFEPYVLRQPADYAEYERRMSDAARRFPNDAEIAFFLALAKSERAPVPEQLAELERAVALDPNFTLARAALAERELYAGDFDTALRTIDECLRVTPSAAHCALLRADLFNHRGDCHAVETEAQRIVSIDPDNAHGYRTLANALFARGHPEAARAALEQAWRRPSTLKLDAELEDRSALAVLSGDFAAALRDSDQLREKARSSPIRGVHAAVTKAAIELLLEIGKTREAGELAKQYLDQKDGWLADPRREDFAILRDPTPFMLATAVHAGVLDRDAAATARQKWIEDWNRTALPSARPFIWPNAWAVGSETPEEAKQALVALDRGATLPRFQPLSTIAGDIGRTFLLADRADDALPWLTSASKRCTPLDAPIENTRVALALGMAHEKKRDAKAACDAYSVVFERWGHAEPASKTAEVARQRMKALACRP